MWLLPSCLSSSLTIVSSSSHCIRLTAPPQLPSLPASQPRMFPVPGRTSAKLVRPAGTLHIPQVSSCGCPSHKAFLDHTSLSTAPTPTPPFSKCVAVPFSESGTAFSTSNMAVTEKAKFPVSRELTVHALVMHW